MDLEQKTSEFKWVDYFPGVGLFTYLKRNSEKELPYNRGEFQEFIEKIDKFIIYQFVSSVLFYSGLAATAFSYFAKK